MSSKPGLNLVLSILIQCLKEKLATQQAQEKQFKIVVRAYSHPAIAASESENL